MFQVQVISRASDENPRPASTSEYMSTEMSSKDISPVCSFPAEIIDLFIDSCSEDSSCATLISSSLVCKKWVAATRRHLFSDVTISVGRGIVQFGDLFHSPNATITPFVKSLSIVAADADCRTDTKEKLLVQLLSKLVVVPFHSFSLEFEEGERSTNKRFPLSALAHDLISSYHTVVNLNLNCDFGSLSDLVELVCSLPLLEAVDLSPRIEDTSICPQSCPSSTLRKMIINQHLLPILDWISTITPDHSISDISLVYTPLAEESRKISRFLKLQGRKLTQLALKAKPCRQLKDAHIDISSNSGLHRLELHSLPSDHLEDTLNSLFAPLLTEIVIDFGPQSEYVNESIGRTLDEILSGPRYHQLKSLTVGRVSWMHGLEESFSSCRSRGILRWVSSNPTNGMTA